jgi:metal-responsive CopG/Arc/MetJ family transcriptional regulator
MKGKAKTIQSISDKLLSIKNVRHGKVTITAAGKILA